MNLDQNLTKCEKEQEANVAHDILYYIIEFLCKLLVFHLDWWVWKKRLQKPDVESINQSIFCLLPPLAALVAELQAVSARLITILNTIIA